VCSLDFLTSQVHYRKIHFPAVPPFFGRSREYIVQLLSPAIAPASGLSVLIAQTFSTFSVVVALPHDMTTKTAIIPSGVEALEHNHQKFVLLTSALPSLAGANHAWRAAAATLLSCFKVV
jgi:hypothetical protein